MFIQPVLFLVGVILAIFGAFMLAPALVEWVTGGPDADAFLVSGGATGVLGMILVQAFRGEHEKLEIRQIFVLTNVAWLASCGAAALPFMVSSADLSVTDAFFEAMSGLTTTGSTVLAGLDRQPKGILLWRGMIHAIGGVGIIVMAMSVLPRLHVAGMQLFQSESSDRSAKVLPHWAQLVRAIALTYIGLTFACTVVYFLLGMSAFDAVVHAMSTIATGGFANYDASFAAFQSPALEWAAVAFMVAGALPLIFYIQLASRQHRGALQNPQIRALLVMLAVVIAVMTVWLWATRNLAFHDALRLVAFGVVSVVTTTGFATSDYSAWGSFAVVAFFLLTFVGGCTGSTAGGIKMFHFQVLISKTGVQIRRLFHPHGVFVARYAGRAVPDSVVVSVLAFFIVYILTFAGVSLGLALVGLDPVTALSGAATALANVGPGLGEIIGPAGNFAPLPDAAKWLLALAMLMGRLELFTVLVLLAPSFWRT